MIAKRPKAAVAKMPAAPEPVVEEAEEAEEEVEVDAEMGGGEEAEAPVSNGTVHEKEPEVDDEAEDGPRVAHDVIMNNLDATPDVILSGDGSLLTSLSQGSFRLLLSGIRANTGAKAGRYMFEVKVLETVPEAAWSLTVGFSTKNSSLFLGDGSTGSLGFDNSGTHYWGGEQPGESSSKPKACKPFGTKVVGVVLNRLESGPAAGTISVFLDGVRAGPPMKLPRHLKGQALYPALTFKNCTLAVNLGAESRRLWPLPFTCRTFAEMSGKHHEASGPKKPASSSKQQVVVAVGLPDEGLFDCVDKYLEEHPDFVELSGRALAVWCEKSGLKAKGPPSEGRSRDSPDLAFGAVSMSAEGASDVLRSLARLGRRNYIFAHICDNLQRTEREGIVKAFAPSAEKVAIVAVGEPSKTFKEWVHGKIKAEYEQRAEVVRRRISIAEATGDTLSEEESQLPPEPELGDSVVFLPKADSSVPDVSQKAVSATFAKWTLPVKDEGFSKIEYPWLAKDAAEAYLRKGVLERKASLIVEGLKPSEFSLAMKKAWTDMRLKLRENHQAFKALHKDSSGDNPANDLASIPVDSVDDVHDADFKGTPLYANFKYEDWLILSWRVELHTLVHCFAHDVDDDERPGIPEAHMQHYYSVYFGGKLDASKLGCKDLAAAVKLLRQPAEIVDAGKTRVLRSQLPADTAMEEFIRKVEGWRRDRLRRVEAGDESAVLNFPAPAKAAGKAPMAKVAAGKAVVVPPKTPPGKAAVAKAPVAKAPISKAPLAKTPVAKSPGAVDKVPAKAPVVKAPVGKTPPVAKAPVAKVPAGAAGKGVKRPLSA